MRKNLILGLVLLLGIGIFLFAMWWDGSDRARLTRRSDVAFWLHLLAAPMIVHPVFTLLGLTTGQCDVGEGLVVILLYVTSGSPHCDRSPRAAGIGAGLRPLCAAANCSREFGAVELNVALTALVIGSALLLLSAFWHQARADRPAAAGTLRDRLPVLDRTAMVTHQPHKRPLERGKHASSSWPRLSTAPCSPTRRERPLLQPKLGAFFDADFGPLGMAAIGREDGDFGIDAQRIVAPMTGRDHAPVEIEDPGKLHAVESGNRAPVPRARERRDDAQALLAFGRG